jgi:outer membrane protein OmpA-like peptidoglycan-associated protein
MKRTSYLLRDLRASQPKVSGQFQPRPFADKNEQSQSPISATATKPPLQVRMLAPNFTNTGLLLPKTQSSEAASDIQGTNKLKFAATKRNFSAMQLQADSNAQPKTSLLQFQRHNILRRPICNSQSTFGQSIQKTNSPLIQRYQTIDSSKYNLEQDMSQDARDPFTRFDAAPTVQAPPTGKRAKVMGKVKHLDQLPPLNVANDSTIAINANSGEPKEFYADNQVIGAANTQLEAVDSPVELNLTGNKIKLPGKGENESPIELMMIQPGLKGKAQTGRDQFVEMQHVICRDFARQIMGGVIRHAILQNQNETWFMPVSTDHGKIIGGTHSLAKSLTQEDVNIENIAEAIEQERKEDTLDMDKVPKVGEQYGKRIRSDKAVQDKAKAFGINESAKPSVGEGYVTQTISNENKSMIDFSTADNHLNQFVWGYHYGAVVAESGDRKDQITLENYNRQTDIKTIHTQLLTELKKDFAKDIENIDLEGLNDADQIGSIMALVNDQIKASKEEARKVYDKMYLAYVGNFQSHWYFRMVGQQKGQSFHEQMASSNSFTNPMTLSVFAQRPFIKKLVGSLESIEVKFDKGSSELNEQSKQVVNMAAHYLNTAKKVGFVLNNLTVTGHGNGWGKGVGATKMGLSRAVAVLEALKTCGVDETLLKAQGAGRIKSKDSSTSRVVKFTVGKS